MTTLTSTLQNLIGGKWQDSRSDSCLQVTNPATEEVVAQFPAGCADDVDAAVAAAVEAQRSWAAMAVSERVALLHRFADAVAEHAAELAELECREMGKPVRLGQGFIEGAVQGFHAAAAQALSYDFEQTILGEDGSTTRIVRHPLGATAVITPWNFPVPMVLGALGPLLAAGNTVVVKPSERSPLSTSRLMELAAVLPPGVVNLVLGDGRAGAPLAEHEDIQLVHFTGSIATGRQVGSGAGRLLHRAVLELGGKDPVVIDAGVDPVATAAAVAFGAFVNTGQICTSMERIYVHRDIAEPFVAALVEAAAGYRLGDGHDEQTVLGPLVDARQRAVVDRHVSDAVARGATVRAGGAIPTARAS